MLNKDEYYITLCILQPSDQEPSESEAPRRSPVNRAPPRASSPSDHSSVDEQVPVKRSVLSTDWLDNRVIIMH